MADEDIDSLLEQGIRAAAEEQGVHIEARTSDAGSLSAPNAAAPATAPAVSASGEKRRSRSNSRSKRRSHSRSSSRPSRRRSSRRSRSRSRSSSRRHRDRSRDRDRRRSRSQSRSRTRHRRRDRDRRLSRSAEKEKEKEPRPRSTSAERAERAKQRELMELTRDHRTVFVGQLTQKVRDRDLDKFFSRVGKIEHVLLIRDKFTNRSKGFAYVEMSNLEDIPKVLMLNGIVPDFQSFPIMIKASEAEKNFAARKDSVMNNVAKAQQDNGAELGTGSCLDLGASYGDTRGAHSAAARIYCGNLHTNITEDDLRAVFQAFGEVLSVHINRDPMGRSKGFGFIQFNTPQEANFAMSKGNGLELAGNYLKLGPVHDNAGESTKTASTWKLEDEEGIGLSMNAQSRTALMAKLAGATDMFPNPAAAAMNLFPGAGAGAGIGMNMGVHGNAGMNPVAPVVTAQQAERAAALASVGIEGSESFCFVIKNMFDVDVEMRSGNPEWHVEIQQDVAEECSSYGTVLHTFVEREKPGGLVYVLFGTVASAVDAASKLHGRWFNKRQISVRYLSSQEYVGMFPEVRSAVQTARANGA